MTEEEKIQSAAHVKAALRKIFDAQTSLPALNELATALTRAYGGADKFADMHFTLYQDSKNSPMTRAKLLESVVRLNLAANAKREDNPIADLTDDELFSVAKDIMDGKNG